MRTLRDLDEKPYIEIISGRWVEKVSPVWRHGVVQIRLGAIVLEQAKGHGLVASQWRVHLSREPATRTTLVPDIAFVSHERLENATEDDIAMPPFAPDLAVEVRSPGDRESDIQEKIALYLRYGSALVLDVVPAKRRIVAHAPDGVKTFAGHETFSHPAVPWLSFVVSAALGS